MIKQMTPTQNLKQAWTPWKPTLYVPSTTSNKSTRRYSNFIDDQSDDSEYGYSGYWSRWFRPVKGGNSQDSIWEKASTLNTIGNFVRILVPEKNIKVNYATQGNSFSTLDSVTISYDSTDKNFDSAVGLALHEASHIKYTDRRYLDPTFFTESLWDFYRRGRNDFGFSPSLKSVMKAMPAGITDRVKFVQVVNKRFYWIYNWIEDRRIDNLVTDAAPGYSGYYKKLYEKYFGNEELSKRFKTIKGKKIKVTEENYQFAIVNMLNSNVDLDCLPGLRKIYDMIGLQTIGRLKSTEEAFNLAIEVFKVIQQKIEEDQSGEGEEFRQPGKPGDGESGDGDGQGDGQGDGESGDGDGNGEPVEWDGKTPLKMGKPGSGGKKFVNTPALQEAMEKLLKLIAGSVEKQEAEDSQVAQIQTINSVKSDVSATEYSGSNIDAQYIRNINYSKADKKYVPGLDSYKTMNPGVIEEAFARGKRMRNMIQVRRESQSDTVTHLNVGKFDKRLLYSAGIGVENLFNQKTVNQYKDAYVHLSIDNSGSMGGEKIKQAIQLAITIASSLTTFNIRVSITLRSTDDDVTSKSKCYITEIYDSERHTLKQLGDVMQYVICTGTTPDSLCFNAIEKDLIDRSKGKDAYFINICDGESYFNGRDVNGTLISYGGQGAVQHVNSWVKKIERSGIKVISYFIESSRSSASVRNDFESAYGKENAHFISTTDITKIAKSLNKKLLKV